MAGWLRRKAKRGFRGYPIATVAFYGPTGDLATKVVAAIIPGQGSKPNPLRRWFFEGTDVRNDSAIRRPGNRPPDGAARRALGRGRARALSLPA